VDPPKKFPEIGKYLSANAQDKHLGTGTFGDVWKAWDAEQNSYVAVKAFHMNGKHISWKTAGEWGQELLEKQKEECAAVQDIVKKGLQMGSPYNGYVQYLCQCYADHIEKDFSSEPAFLVLEFCGRDVYHDIIEKARKGATPPQNRDYLRQRRHIIQDVLKGLSVLQNLNPPLMHHDIKPDNICVSDSSGKPIAKLVDFAARMIATEDTKKSAAISHPAYRPPEVATGRTSGWAWDGEPWSYDIYSLGLVYTELLCPAVTRTYWLNTEEKNPTPKEWSPQEAISAECKALAGLGLDPDFILLGRMTSFKPAERPPPVDCVAEMDKMADAP